MDKINKETLEHLLSLARLDVAEGDKAKLLSDIRSILGYVDLLNEADTKGVEPMTGGNLHAGVLREDGVDIDEKKRNISGSGHVIEAFPAAEDGYLKTPPVF